MDITLSTQLDRTYYTYGVINKFFAADSRSKLLITAKDRFGGKKADHNIW